MRARVIGCGVAGLSCALRLVEAGFEVEIWARALPPHTTSNVAAAIWYAYKAGPADKVEVWARASYAEFQRLARDPQSGVQMRTGLELLPERDAAPEWRAELVSFRAARRDELRPGSPSGFVFAVPVIEMPIYLEFLKQRFLARGGVIRERAIATLADAWTDAPLVVHCSGLGARTIVDDRELHPIRGQVVRVERRAVELFALDDYAPAGITYVVPRAHDCVLGGSAEEGREDLEPDESETRAILSRCRALVPALAGARVLGTAVGLRPGRASVRLEAECPRPGTLVVHDYGHGGAGVTLSWGCADSVLALARAFAAQNLKMR